MNHCFVDMKAALTAGTLSIPYIILVIPDSYTLLVATLSCQGHSESGEFQVQEITGWDNSLLQGAKHTRSHNHSSRVGLY